LPQLGILFDIDELGAGLYGYRAYQILFEAIDTRNIAGCSLSDGDTNGGVGPEYCIAIDVPYASQIVKIKNTLNLVDMKGLLPQASRFLEDAAVRREPLVFAGRINFNGDLVDCNTPWVFEAWHINQPKHLASKQAPVLSTIIMDSKEEDTESQIDNDINSIQWQIGDIIENRWEIKEKFEGGLGIVYVGYDRGSGETFAAKTFRDDVFAYNSQIAKRFVREAANWVNLDFHPNITQAKSIEFFGGKPFLFLEYVSGGDLSKWVGTPRLTENPAQALQFAIQFCDGMTYAGSRGIKVHRDIKPENCLITEDNILKVSDFGLAKAFDDVDSTIVEHNNSEKKEARNGWLMNFFSKGNYSSTHKMNKQSQGTILTRVGAIVGTCTHMAPEQFDDAKHVDVQADIYSFGILLYQMLIGELPFHGNTPEEFEAHHKNTRPPKLHLPSITSQSLVFQINSIVQTCLAKKNTERFKDFEEIRQSLANIYQALTGKTPYLALTGSELDISRLNDKGLGLINLGKFSEGLDQLNRAIELSSHLDGDSNHNGVSALIWNNKGLALAKLAKMEEALHCFEQAIEIVDTYSHAWNNKGAVLMNFNRDREALTCFERAIEIDSYYVMAINNKGSALDKLGQSGSALGCFNLALHYNPHCAEAWFNKGLNLGMAGNIQEAMFHFEQAKQLGLPQAAQIIKQLQKS
jgi:serine/threonine protein kinase